MLRSVLRTKIIPPPRHIRTLIRPRITDSIAQAFEYRLTILQAEAGYGKSTALIVGTWRLKSANIHQGWERLLGVIKTTPTEK